MTTLYEWIAFSPLPYIIPAALVFSIRNSGALAIAVVLSLTAAFFFLFYSERGADMDGGWNGIIIAIVASIAVIIGATARGLHLLLPTKAHARAVTTVSTLLLASPVLFWLIPFLRTHFE